MAYFHNDALKFLARSSSLMSRSLTIRFGFDVSDDDLWQGYYKTVLSLLGRDQAHRSDPPYWSLLHCRKPM